MSGWQHELARSFHRQCRRGLCRGIHDSPREGGMTILAISLYGLGIIGALASTSRDAPIGLREWAIGICWPLAVAVATLSGLIQFIWSGARP